VNPFQSLRDYEEFVYTLPQRFSSIVSSTLVVVRRGGRMVTVSGEIVFRGGYRLVVKERLTFDAGPLVLTRYGYEFWHEGDKFCWYDSQPHPIDPALAATHPHHKHIPPDIKHNRVPAPELSFTKPNLSFLIQEIGQLVKT
jgi:hypothetical protein